VASGQAPPPPPPPVITLDAANPAVELLITDLANELAETQQELQHALQLLRVKLEEDQAAERVTQDVALSELHGLRQLNEYELARSMA
jgi:hypothetical protein